MNKRAFCDVLSRVLGAREGRLVSLTQRLSEAGLLATNHSRRPDFDLMPVEAARMVLVAIADDGLAAAPDTIRRLGSLVGRGCNLEQALSHALSRPESLAPCRAGLEMHVGDQAYGILTVVSADGARSNVFGDIPETENVDRLVTVSGAALFAIAQEFAGKTPAEVNALLEGATEMKPAASAVN
jgi:hypothetical protein